MLIQNNITVSGEKIEHLVTFDSYGEAIQLIKGKGNVLPNCGESFSGSKNLAEAIKLSENGWPEGLNKARELLAAIEPKLCSFIKQRVPQYHYAGGNPDVGVFLANDPECFIGNSTVEREGVGGLARIVVNPAASGSFGTRELLVRGAAVIACVDAMEAQGRSCEIIIRWTSGWQRGLRIYEIPIKKQGEHVDPERVAFAVGHPSFLRRVMFGIADHLHPGSDGNGYGRPTDTKITEGDLYFKAMSHAQCPDTDEGLLQWVLDMLKSQGIELEDE